MKLGNALVILGALAAGVVLIALGCDVRGTACLGGAAFTTLVSLAQ